MYQGKRVEKTKKTALLMASLALAFTMVAGTVALLITDTDPVENVFTPAEVTSRVDEIFEENVKSDVSVTNTGDVDAYIRAAIIVNWATKRDESDENASVIYGQPVTAVDYTLELSGSSKWVPGADGYYYYTEKVGPDEPTDTLIKACYPNKDKAPEGYALSVKILSSAIQADGMSGNQHPVELAWENDKVGITVKDNGDLTITNKTQSGEG